MYQDKTYHISLIQIATFSYRYSELILYHYWLYRIDSKGDLPTGNLQLPTEFSYTQSMHSLSKVSSSIKKYFGKLCSLICSMEISVAGTLTLLNPNQTFLQLVRARYMAIVSGCIFLFRYLRNMRNIYIFCVQLLQFFSISYVTKSNHYEHIMVSCHSESILCRDRCKAQ